MLPVRATYQRRLRASFLGQARLPRGRVSVSRLWITDTCECVCMCFAFRQMAYAFLAIQDSTPPLLCCCARDRRLLLTNAPCSAAPGTSARSAPIRLDSTCARLAGMCTSRTRICTTPRTRSAHTTPRCRATTVSAETIATGPQGRWLQPLFVCFLTGCGFKDCLACYWLNFVYPACSVTGVLISQLTRRKRNLQFPSQLPILMSSFI